MELGLHARYQMQYSRRFKCVTSCAYYLGNILADLNQCVCVNVYVQVSSCSQGFHTVE